MPFSPLSRGAALPRTGADSRARLPRSLDRLIRVVLAIALTTTGVVIGGIAGAAPASALNSQSCGFATAGTGTYAQTVCWFDLSGFNAGQAGSATGQQMTQSLPGGYTLSFTMTTAGGPIHSTVLPTYSGAYLGNNGHYTGIPGQPALYQTSSGTTTTATLTNIVARDNLGAQVTGYALVGADAESTDATETLSWSSSAAINSLTQTSTGNGLGNACAAGFSGVGTTQVTCAGSGSGSKTGTAILASTDPATFSQTMHGQGLEAFAFGVLVSRMQLDKKVTDGFPGDAFHIAVTDARGSPLGTANTGGTATASTGLVTVLSGQTSQDYSFSETATSGALSNYSTTWVCTRNGSADAALPTGLAAATAVVAVGVGDFVNCTITNTAKKASVSLIKSAGVPVDVNHDGLVDAGDTVNYTFTVTNTGALSLFPVSLSDPKIGAISCPQSTLPSAAVEVCTAAMPYVITAADMAAGEVVNTATVAATPAGTTGAPVTSTSSTHTPVVSPNPRLGILKTVEPSQVSAAGEVVTYSFAVTNDGNVPLTNVELSEESFTGTGPAPQIFCPATFLLPTASETCVASYTATQADVDAGMVSNTATATGIPAGLRIRTAATPSTATFTAVAAPAMTLIKSAEPSAPAAFTTGQQVTYSYVMTNTGNVSLTKIAVVEGAFTGTGHVPIVRCPNIPLSIAPGGQITCTASYLLTQADVLSGTVSNTATASAADPSDASISAPESTASIPVLSNPSLRLQNLSDPTVVHEAGQIINYTFLITNTGNTTLQNIAVHEDQFTGSGAVPVISCPSGAILPGQTALCTGSYAVQAADLFLPAIVNSATGRADFSERSATATVSTEVLVAALDLRQTETSAPVVAVGQIITFTDLLTNIGNTPLIGIALVEIEFTGTGPAPVSSCPAATLAVGASETCSATYTTTAEDLRHSSISNTVVADSTLLGFANPIQSNISTMSTLVLIPLAQSPDPGPPIASPASETLALTGSDPVLPALSGLLLLLAGILVRRWSSNSAV